MNFTLEIDDVLVLDDLGFSPSKEDNIGTACEYSFANEVEMNIDTMNILHWNICGLLNKQDGLTRLIRSLGGSNKVSAVCLNETWLRSETSSKVDISGYNFVSKNRHGKKGGGVGILISKELNYHIPNLQLPENPEIECMVVELKCKQDSLLLVNMYRPPNTKLPNSIKVIHSILSKVMQLDKPTVVCTDHNINLLNASSHRKTQEFLESCIDLGLFPCITKPIRITHSSATLIDNIFLSTGIHDASTSWILEEDMSDHLPCLTSISRMRPDNVIEHYIWKRKLNDKSIERIKKSLDQNNWQNLLEGKSCNAAFECFHNILLSSIDDHAPEKSVKVSYKSVQPWMSKGLLKCLSKQKRMYCGTLK